MVCTMCRKHIDSGAHRVREGRNGYITQHRDCTESDPEWAEMDRQEMDYFIKLQKRLEAYKAFREQWGEYELDETIRDIEERLSLDADNNRAANDVRVLSVSRRTMLRDPRFYAVSKALRETFNLERSAACELARYALKALSQRGSQEAETPSPHGKC